MKRSGLARIDRLVLAPRARGSPGAWSAPPCTRWAAPRPSRRRNCSALKPGVQNTLPPAASDDSTAAISPWMWNSGMMLRQRSPAVSGSVCAMLPAEAQRLRWRQRHDLRPRRGARGVQHQRDILRARLALRRWHSTRLPAQRETARAPIRLRRQRDDLHAELFGRIDGRRGAALLHDQQLRAQVGQVELELIGLVVRVQRRGGSMSRDA